MRKISIAVMAFFWMSCEEPFCLDGKEQEGEECDDGNDIEGDGCDSNCTVTACGNNILTDGEQCDDGDASDGGGCSSLCALQTVVLTTPPVLNSDDFFLPIFQTTSQLFDFDNDGQDETVVNDLLIAVSSDPDLCQKAQAAGGVFAVLPLNAAVLFVRKPEALPAQGFVSGDSIQGGDFTGDPFFDQGLQIVSVDVRQGNNVAESEVGGTLNVQSFDGFTLSGTLSSELNLLNGASTQSDVDATILGATSCQSLFAP